MGETDEDALSLDTGEKPGISFGAAARRPSTWLVFISAALIVIGSGTVLQHTVSYLVTNGFSVTAAGAVSRRRR